MTEPTITCPGCKAEIKLTELLAAPILESARRDFELRMAQKDADFVVFLPFRCQPTGGEKGGVS